MVKKDFFRLSAVACILVALAVLSSTAPTAHAATKPQCAVTDITLHGTAAPTVKCQSTKITYPSNANGVHPNTVTDPNCYSQSNLALYWNGPISHSPNYVLCIGGFGLLNLNQQFETSPDFSLRNWNDQASAWWTGCSNVTFYTDINRRGASGYEPGSIFGLYSPSGGFPVGGVGNDQLSSVWLANSAYC